MQRRQNTNSGEFLLHWETKPKAGGKDSQPIGDDTNRTVRATARVNINSLEEFVRFNVELNSIPIQEDKIGKDVIVDWSFLDGFDTKKKLYVDANGLQMIDKELYHRKEYPYESKNPVAANYYPMTSAIAIRNENTTSVGGRNQRQITIMNDRSQGASAGLRGQRNIEIMQQRRFKKFDHYGVDEPLNDLDKWGRGIQVPANYYMFINDKAKTTNRRAYHSKQRDLQRRIDQPLTFHYSAEWSIQ